MNHNLSYKIAIVGEEFPANFIIDRLGIDIEDVTDKPEVVVVIPSRCNLVKFFETINQLKTIDLSKTDVLVLLSSTDIYNLTQSEMADEDSPLTPNSPWLEIEKSVSDIAKEHPGMRLITLRLPLVMGTGMQGILAEIAAGILSGTYRHILPAHAEAHHSVVHAADVAAIIPALVDSDVEGVYHLTDGQNPSTQELSEAIAWRVDHKRIYSIPPKWQKFVARVGRLLKWDAYSPSRLTYLSTPHTFSDARLRAALPSFTTTSVTVYLRTHNYDNDRI